MKNMKKLAALILALVLVLSLTATAFAVTTDTDFSDGIYGEFNTTDKDDSVTVDSDKTIEIKKELTAYNPDASTVHAPVITYTYTITAGSPDKNIIDNAAYHYSNTSSNVLTKAGIIPGLAITGAVNGASNATATTAAGGATSVSDSIVWNNTGTLTTAADGAANLSDLKLDFTNVIFNAAGVYRYVITEHTSAYGTNGVVNKDGTETNTDQVRYLDVYVKDGANANEYDVYGYVCFKNNNNIEYPTSGSVAAAEKTNGFVDTDTSATDASNADKYYTFDVEIKKNLVGDKAKNNNKFPFKVTFANTKVTSTVLLTIDSTGTVTVPTAESAVIASTVYDGSVSSGDKQIAIAHNGTVKIIGIPAGTEVTIDELNNVTGTTYKVKTENGTTNLDPEVAVQWTMWAGTQNTTAGTAATALGGTANNNSKVTSNFTAAASKTIIFTNTLELISPTGVALRVAPYALMLAAGMFLFILITRRRREEAEEA